MATVYGLIDPTNNELFYIGHTARNLFCRLGNHIYMSNNAKVKKPVGVKLTSKSRK